MFVLHIELNVDPGQQEDLERTYREVFRPAVSVQSGFVHAELLQPVEGGSSYCLGLAFDQQASQQNWVATDLHERVWPAMLSHCTGFGVKRYHTA